MRMASVTTVLAALALIGAAPASAQPVCGEVITQNTTLTADLNCNRVGEGITIGAPGITLDLGGHGISTLGTAVRNPGYANVTIRNGSIGFDTRGIVLTGATGNTIRDILIEGLVVGIELRDSDDNRIVANRLRSALIDVDSNSDGNVVRENVVTAHEGVISVSGSHTRIVRNVVWTGEDTPMGVGGHYNEVLHNTLVAARSTLLYLGSGGDHLIADNELLQYESIHGDPGVQVAGSSGNLFRDNHVDGAPLGIWVESGADNAFRRNALDGEVGRTFAHGSRRLPGGQRRDRDAAAEQQRSRLRRRRDRRRGAGNRHQAQHGQRQRRPRHRGGARRGRRRRQPGKRQREPAAVHEPVLRLGRFGQG